MTREEKIALLVDELEDIRCDNFDADTDEDKTLKEAVRVIEVLKQEPCEDAVSRQAVLNKKYLIELEDGQSFYCINPEDVEALPPVTPTRKKGKWKWEEDWTPSTPMSPTECNYAGWVCSECGEFPDEYADWDNPDEKPTYKYCPNCGTRMEVDK